MPDRPVATLVAILQRHGLTADALEDMVHFCERQCTGSLTLHVVDGAISLLEDHGKRRISVQERCGTGSDLPGYGPVPRRA
jgi:hypothetical protein